jgi:hypothetical protein
MSIIGHRVLQARTSAADFHVTRIRAATSGS